MSQHHHLLDSLAAPGPGAGAGPVPGQAPTAAGATLGLPGFGGLATGPAATAAGNGGAIDFMGAGLGDLPHELGDGLSWEKLLSQLEEPQSALGEIRQFADQWWGFCESAPYRTCTRIGC